MKSAIRPLFLLISFTLLMYSISFGANRYWIASTNANWNLAANWSATSGGAGGATVPGAADVAIFDNLGLGNCALNAVVNVSGIQINSGYTGNITQSTFNITLAATGFTLSGGTFTRGTATMTTTGPFAVSGGTYIGSSGTLSVNGTATFTLSSGTFTGGSGNITIAGVTTISGGTFNSTSGILTINNNFLKTAGTFNHNSGTVTLGGNATYQLNTNLKLVFNNLSFTGSGTNCIRNVNSDTLDVNGTLSFTGTSRFAIQNSILRSFGNINVTNTYTGQNTHTGGLLLICGTGNQNFSSASATTIQGFLPTVQINKPSGTLFFLNKICVEGNWRYDAGTLDYTTNTNTICFLYGKNFTGSSHSLGNVEFHTPGATNSAFNLGSINLTVNGTLTLSGGTGQLTLQNSTIQAKGDIIITHTRTTTNSSSTLILINGTSNQTITGTATAYQGRLPAVTINKPSGTLFLINNVTIEGNYTYTAGTIDYSTNSNTICFYAVGATQTITGTHNLGSVEFYGSSGNIYSLSGVGMTLTVNGTLTFSGSSQFRMSGGTIHAKGNMAINNTYNANNTHTTNIIVNGIPDQSITSSVASGNGRLPNITVNKTAGTLLLSGTISTESNWTYTAGTVDPQTSTMVFFNSIKTIDCQAAGVMEFYNVTLGDASTRTLLGNMTVRNTLSLQTGRILLNAFTLTLQNGATTALTYSTGAIISENTANNSKVSWMIGSNTGAHIIPFENLSTFDIPFTFNLTSGDAGTVTISTYPTANDNTPYPITPQTVTNVDAVGGIDNSANTVNRFWQIDKTGANPTATLTFTYGDNEWDVSEPSDYNAQRYDDVTDVWQPALVSQTVNPSLNQVIVPGVTTFSPWTLARISTPLAIEMMNYEISSLDKAVLISWGIFEESDITHYTIEKTIDFELVSTIESVPVGNNYYEIKDEHPSVGISYYRVIAHLFNGQAEIFPWKKAEFEPSISLEKVFPNPIKSGNMLTIPILEQMDGLQELQIVDLNGRILHSQFIEFQGDYVQLAIPSFISQGCYILSLGTLKTRITVL